MLAVADLSSSGREKKYYHGQLWLNMIRWKSLRDSRVKYRSEKYRPFGLSLYSGQTKQDKKILNVTKSRKKRKRETFFWLFWLFFYYSRLPQCHLRRIFLCFSFEISALDSESKPTKFKHQSGKIPKIDLNLVKIKGLHTCLFIDLCCDIFIFTVSSKLLKSWKPSLFFLSKIWRFQTWGKAN